MKPKKILLATIITTLIVNFTLVLTYSVYAEKLTADKFITYESTSYDGDRQVSESEEQAFFSKFNNLTGNETAYTSSFYANSSNDEVILDAPVDLSKPSMNGGVFFPPVGNQGDYNSCVAWATTYYQFAFAANKLNNKQNTYSPTWTYNYINYGSNMTAAYTDAYNVLINQGAVKMSEMPYNSSQYDCNSWCNDTTAMMNALKTRVSYCGKSTISGQGTIITSPYDSDLDYVKSLLRTRHILMVRVDSYNDLSNWSFKPNLNHIAGEPDNQYVAYRASSAGSGHAMAIVGYNDNVWCDVNGNGIPEDCEKGAFKLVNSRGNGWKNQGFVWVLYDALNKVSANPSNIWENSELGTRISIFDRTENTNNTLSNDFYYIEVENYDVNMAGMLTFNTSRKNKLLVNLFRKSNSNLNYSNLESITYFGLNTSDPIYNLVRNYNKPFNGSIVLDYSEYDDPVNICTTGYYYGIDVQNLYSTGNYSFTNVSYKIVDDKLNVIKNISSLPSTISNGTNAVKSVRISCDKGDVNYDGQINSIDSNIVMNYVSEIITLSNLQNYLADFNNDGLVNLTDVIYINSYISQHTSSYDELCAIYEINQRIEEIMENNNYSYSEKYEVKKINDNIQKELIEIQD